MTKWILPVMHSTKPMIYFWRGVTRPSERLEKNQQLSVRPSCILTSGSLIDLSMTFSCCAQYPQHIHSALIMSISSSTGIHHAYCVTQTLSPLFLTVGLVPRFIASWFIGLSVTERATTNDRRLASRDNKISVCKAFQSNQFTRLRSELLGGKIFCFSLKR